MALIFRRSIHVKFEDYVADIDLYVHDNFFKQFFEKVHWAVFAYFSFKLIFLHVKLFKLMQLQYFLLKILSEVFVGLEGNLNIRNRDLNTLS